MAQSKKSPDKPLVPLQSICQVLKLSSRRVQQLVSDGVLPSPETVGRSAKYDLITAIWSYFSWKEARAIEKAIKGASRRQAEEEYRTVKAARERLKLEQEQGLLMKKADVASTCKFLLTVVKTALLAQPRSLPALLVEKSEQEISDILEAENRKILEAAATGFGELTKEAAAKKKGAKK